MNLIENLIEEGQHECIKTCETRETAVILFFCILCSMLKVKKAATPITFDLNVFFYIGYK